MGLNFKITLWGFVLFCGILLSVYKTIVSLKSKSSSEKNILLLSVSAILGALVACYVIDNEEVKTFCLMFSIFFAFVTSLVCIVQNSKNVEHSNSIKILDCASLFILYFSLFTSFSSLLRSWGS